MTLHRLLLRVLPRSLRDRYGEEMTAVFAEQREAIRRSGTRSGPAAVGLWARECAGLVALAARAWFGSLRRWSTQGAWFSELRWAWRNVRGRSWRALLIVGLIGVAMSANALVFAAADALVFHRVPFPAADRLVEIHGIRNAGDAGGRYLTRALFDGWRVQTDLFDGVHCYSTSMLFVLGEGGAEQIRTSDITPGLTDALGVLPRWGRRLVAADALERSFHPVLISEKLARERFGDPSRAPGQELDAVGLPLRVVGVMDATFRFPTGKEQIWRALDPRGPISANTFAFQSISRLAPGMTFDRLADQMAQRSPAIGVAAKRGDQYLAAPRPFHLTVANADQRTLFLMLLGAAACLLLTACANVINLELAGAVRRARASAIHLALGASRASLARVALIEGAGLVIAALALAVLLTWLGLDLVRSMLPAAMLTATPNLIDFDARGFGYMTAIAVATWLLASLPVAWAASRVAATTTLLKTDDRTSTASRSARWARQGLLVAEIAFSVLLVITGTLYASSYLSLLRFETGFDSAQLAEISFELPPTEFRDNTRRARFTVDVLARLRTAPGVVGALYGSPPPWGIYSGPRDTTEIAIDDRPPATMAVRIGARSADADDARLLGLRVRRGRWLEPNEPPTNVVVTDAFARRFWPGLDPVGRRFQLKVQPMPQQSEVVEPTRHVVGVVDDIRRSARRLPGPDDSEFMYYQPREPTVGPAASVAAASAATPAPRQVYTGGGLMYLDFTVRLQPGASLQPVLAAAQSVDSGWRATYRSVDDAYAEMFSDVTLSTRLVGVFAGVALIVAIVGVYGLLAFIVAGRTREIGIRMALGADRRDITRLVLSSAGALTACGVALGVAMAVAASRWIEAQLFGVSATEPVVYLGVSGLVVTVALAATWRPARAASHVDPAIVLKAE